MKFEVYCDESRPEYFYERPDRSDRFVVLGSIWIKAHDRPRLKDKIRSIRQRHNLFAEFKWNKVNPFKIKFYLELVKFFFGNEIRIRCIVLAVIELHVIHFHEADNELMFYKFYY